MTTIAIFAPLNDHPSSVSHATAKALYEEVKEWNYKPYYVKTKYCRRKIAEKILTSAPEDTFVFFYGHAKIWCICGDTRVHCAKYGKVGMLDYDNAYVLPMRGHVYAVCCWTCFPKGIGESSIKKEYVKSWCGCRVPMYVAYKKPDYDYRADWIKTYNVYPIRLLETNDPVEAFKEQKKAIDELIKFYKLNTEKLTYGEHYARRHFSNMKNLRLFSPERKVFKREEDISLWC